MSVNTSRVVKKFAQGETLPVKYYNISYAGQTPATLTTGSKTFWLSIVDHDTRDAALNLKNADMTISDTGDDAPYVYIPIDTTSLTAKEEYEVDFWVKDLTGQYRLDHFMLVLDEPETITFV